jgi:hypothetical protein
MKFVIGSASFLLLIWVVLPCAIFRPWPSYGCTMLEGQGALRKTTWFRSNGEECGHAWPDDSGGWYAYVEDSFRRGTVYATKDQAYKIVEWSCRIPLKDKERP